MKLLFGYRIKVKKHIRCWGGYDVSLCRRFREICFVDVSTKVFESEPLKYWAYMIVKSWNAERKNKERVIIPTGYFCV